MNRYLVLLVAVVLGAACTDGATAIDRTPSTIENADGAATPAGNIPSDQAASDAPPSNDPGRGDAVTTTTVAMASTQLPDPIEPCQSGPIPASAGFDPFYGQGCDLDGFWVVAAEEVDSEAVTRAGEFVSTIFASDPALAASLRATDIRLGVIGENQRTTEMPEYRDLNEVFPGTDWDSRARGLGATFERPLVSAGEENVLCLDGDRYRGEDILLHEFAHVLHEFGYATIDPTFQPRLDAAFANALDLGIWDDTYAAENAAEYWAEAVQSYFGRNLSFEVPDGVHGPIDTGAALADADPTVHALIDEKLGSIVLPAGCNG